MFLLLWVINRLFEKKYGITGLVLKIHKTDGKKCVKFVAMQQNCATLIYDKGTVESYIKKFTWPFRTVHFQAWKIAPRSVSLKKRCNVISHLNLLKLNNIFY